MIRQLRSACVLALLAGAACAIPALAQIAEPIPQRRDALSKPMTAQPRRDAMLPCPEYGPGFMRQPGSSTCVRVSGSVRGEVGIQGRRSQLNGQTGFNSQARMTIDSRTQTDIGPVRAVMSVKGQSSSGILNGVR